MGQYYRGSILKFNHKLAKQPVLFALSPYDFNNGAKLMEHSYIGNSYVNAYMEMLSDNNGIYFGYPFVWIGDYADSVKGKEYYDLAREVEEKSFGEHRKNLIITHYHKYLVNFSKKEYVRIPKLKTDVWQMHPLPLLTAYGNGRGGGDYHGRGQNMVGRWAFNKIGVTNDETYLTNMKELTLEFETDF